MWIAESIQTSDYLQRKITLDYFTGGDPRIIRIGDMPGEGAALLFGVEAGEADLLWCWFWCWCVGLDPPLGGVEGIAVAVVPLLFGVEAGEADVLWCCCWLDPPLGGVEGIVPAPWSSAVHNWTRNAWSVVLFTSRTSFVNAPRTDCTRASETATRAHATRKYSSALRWFDLL